MKLQNLLLFLFYIFPLTILTNESVFSLQNLIFGYFNDFEMEDEKI